jgi:hypothetical protein
MFRRDVSWGGRNMRSVWRTILLAAAAAPLAGCLTYGSIQNRGTVINEGVGEMQNRGTLLNLVRASRSEPLYFLSVNQIQAQSSAQLQLGLPQVVARGLLPGSAAIPKGTLIFGNNNTNIAQTNTNTNFQVGVYSSKDFYAGLLTPLGLDEVDLLLHQGFSRELVFYLVIDKVKVTPQPNGESYILFNDPSDPANWAAFKALVQDAMQFGITTEVPPTGEGAGPTQVKAQTGSGSGGATLGNAGAIQFMLTAQNPPSKARLCFERALATADAKQQFDKLANKPLYCGDKREEENNTTYVVLNGQELKIEVIPRSTYGIFAYLGRIMPDPPVLTPFPLPEEKALSGALLTVNTGAPLPSGCFTSVSYAGKNYCVPQEGDDSTKSIFNILTALVALKQSPGDLPATQSVLVAP